MAVAHVIAEHDVVRFRKVVGKWSAGTVGTVVGDFGGVVLVEIANERGEALDFVQVPVAQLEIDH